MSVVDLRPPGLTILFRPDNAYSIVMEWPAGALLGRTFTAVLGEEALTVTPDGDTLTVRATAAQTASITRATSWALREDVAGIPHDVIVGRWIPSDSPNAGTSQTVVVTDGSVAVAVTVVGGGGGGGGPVDWSVMGSALGYLREDAVEGYLWASGEAPPDGACVNCLYEGPTDPVLANTVRPVVEGDIWATTILGP